VARLFPDEVALVLDGGTAPGKAPSTIVDLSGTKPHVLREGAIPAAALDQFLQ
jgi:tRNA A37 threonylcarbamoyladenosine synthetase subunit TsaC/SUA5/YrdC